MVERHRNAEPVIWRKAHQLAGEQSIVQQVVVGEGGTFGRTRRAAGELDVDRVVELQASADIRKQPALFRGATLQDRIKADGPAMDRPAELEDGAQLGQRLQMQVARRAVRKVRCNARQHPEIVAGLECRCCDQRTTSNLAQHILQLSRPICRIDVYQDEAGLCRRKLGNNPLCPVG